MSYIAYTLTKSARSKVLAAFPPKFSDVIAHHITYKFGVTKAESIPHPPSSVKVIGYSSDASLEALVVEVNGKSFRPDGKRYHITLSLEKGRKPVESNTLILKNGFEEVKPFAIETTVEFLS